MTTISAALATARQQHNAGQLEAAEQIYGQILQEDPGHPKAVAGLARCYLESGDLDRAKKTLGLVKPDGAAVKGTLVIDAASFDTKNEKRDDHLRSEDNANRAGDGRFNSPGRPKGAAWRTGRRAQSAP